jgi:hypothetical protein
MWRRLGTLGQQASKISWPMSPSPGESAPSPDGRATSGLASVFKGFAGSKLTKHPSNASAPLSQTSIQALANGADAEATDHVGWSREHMDLLERLKDGGAPLERAAAADALRLIIADYPQPALEIWEAGKDLIDGSYPVTAREAGWRLLVACVKHGRLSDVERNEYFQTLSAPANLDDFHFQLQALIELTNHGRDLSGFEYQVVPLLSKWLGESFQAVRSARRTIAHATRTTSKATSRGKATASIEDKNFERLFEYIIDVLKYNSRVADDDAIAGMIERLQDICVKTSVESDLKFCIGAINAIVTYSTIRAAKLKDCVLLLSSIFCMVGGLEKDAWHAIANLFKSHHGQSAVRILLDVLRNPTPPPARKEKGTDPYRDIKGALCVLQKLMAKTTEKGYPTVPLALLIDGLHNVTKVASSKVAVAILKLIASLFDSSSDGQVNDLLVDEDWSVVLDVAAECAQKITGAPSSDLNGSVRSPSSSTSSSDKQNEVISSQLLVLVDRLEALLKRQDAEFLHRQECVAFLARVQHVLPESAALLVLDYFRDFRSCFPSDIDWEANLRLVLRSFFLNRRWSTTVRRQAIAIVIEVYDMLDLLQREVGSEIVESVIKQVLSGIPEENDTVVLREAVDFAVGIATSADMELFHTIMETMKQVLLNDRTKSPITLQRTADRGDPIANQSPSNVVTRGYVQLFIRSAELNVAKAVATYTALVHVARSTSSERDARLTAMKMLFRLRADWANRVFVISNPEAEGLAAYLYRTPASLARRQADDAMHASRHSKSDQGQSSRSARGVSFTTGQSQERHVPSRNTTGASKHSIKYQQLWTLPDDDALPESPSPRASPILFSRAVDSVESKEGDEKSEKGYLDLSTWLDTLLLLLTSGGDWEVYSFILVHLPSQLSNHGIFRGAILQIQELRKLVCEMLRMNTFQEPPNASGPRRTDVAICLFNTLTMLLSYHNHFQKSEEDELVRTFMQGIADRTAKTCIHALSISCHELPLSVSKSLSTILHKMSQIITQPHVAMHILEFAATLSRMPHLYSNFHEEEYKIVFAICFTYLQSVRERKRAVRASHASEGSVPSVVVSNFSEPTASEDLPQYVYALAYHVITFWFLAVKLQDRPSHIGWIAKNLFTDAEASASEEQAQVTMDFLQRVTYADVADSAEDPLFTVDRFGKIAQKQWIIGNSILTIKQATESGWAEVTKRQPSGTSAWTVQETFLASQPHERRATADHNGRDAHIASRTTVMPSHLLVQLLTTVPQGFEPGLRPLPLPEDDQVGRGIRTFDRISSVDGHKVGVIYVGEGQTKENEILANVSGSRDYTSFLEGLGTLTKLKGATFNTQGLDREYDSDGPYTVCWRDRVTEMVFHVTTQMPTNLDHDRQCSLKKRHIGNDFVNIIWNDSGFPFDFNTFPSEFNYVNIVITPESRSSFVAAREKALRAQENGHKGNEVDESETSGFTSPFHKVQVMGKPGFPEISPAADTKMVSLTALPGFVRGLALNASVFSLVWANREGGEHVSSWRARLREINRLRERFRPKGNPSPTPPPIISGGISSGAASGAGSSSSGSTITQVTMAGQSQQAQQQLLQLQRDQQQQQQQQRDQQMHQASESNSRPTSSVRDSFSSLRRASVATFFTNTSEQTSHRSSVLTTGTTDTEVSPGNGLDHLVDSLDFSKWA